MIADREIALDLAKRWGEPKDMDYLSSLVSQGIVGNVEMRKVLDYWVKKVNDELNKIMLDQSHLNKTKSSWVRFIYVCQKMGEKDIDSSRYTS